MKMYPNHHQGPNGPWNNDASRNPHENNFSGWENVNLRRQIIPNAPPHGNFNVPPPGTVPGSNFDQTFGSPAMFCPPFPGGPFMPPQMPSQNYAINSVNESVARAQSLPQHVFQEQPPISQPVSCNQFESFMVPSLQFKSVSEWLENKSLCQPVDAVKPRQPFWIHEFRIELEKCMSSARELQNLSLTMKGNVETLSDEEWDGFCHKMETLKKIIKDKLEYVTDPKILASVKIQLRKRQKKRASLGRRNAAYHQERVKKENDRKIVSQQIDDWMIAQVEIAASVKRDEQLKKEAQLVLSEVTRRTTEATRQLDLLSGLEKLRLLKRQLTQNQQDSNTVDSLIVFENLKQMWTAKLKEYELEEQGLRVMLSEANLETIKSKKHLEEEALNSWKTLLFGTEDSHQFYSDFNELLLIRSQWDKFSIPHNSTAVAHSQISSLIPIGWVLPTASNGTAWEKYLSKY